MAEVIVRENETFEAALRRFTKGVQQNGVLAEARRKYYDKPSVRRKKKEAATRRRSRK